MPPLRLFLALLPPQPVRAEIAALVAPLPGVRWVPPANLHLTLRFLGECAPHRHERFAEVLARVRVEPFIVPVAGVGLFPPRGPAQVLWAGLGHAHPRLFQLRKQVDEALLAADPGLAVRHFHPHFTVGRVAPGADPAALAGFLARCSAWEAPPFRVDAFHLLASELLPGRAPAYRTLRAYPLVG